MRVLVVGSGGREHALVWKIARSPMVSKIYCAPGNPGMVSDAECVDIKAIDIPALLAFAREKSIDLAVIGPEAPLTKGIADEFRASGIRTFGPSKAAAEIEGSKVFSKELLAKYGIPTAGFRVFDDPHSAGAYIEELSGGSEECPIVVKADGEALGKGVYVCDTRSEALAAVESIMVDKIHGKAGDRIVVEERIYGPEASLMVITDGEKIIPMMPVQDHKRAYDGDRGPNTGGMGCYSPVPIIPADLYRQLVDTIIKPSIDAMRAEGRPYTGVLYTGILFTDRGPQVLEFNARFGDPETQVALPLLQSDLVELILASLNGSLDSVEANWYNGSAVCVVIASGGYPGDYETGKPISGLDEANSLDGVTVFHAGTKFRDGGVVTSGGRVLGVTALGDDFRTAIDRAYAGVKAIHFDGMHYRTDIGARTL